MEPEFPSNSERSKRQPEEKNISPVVSGGVSRKKKSLRKQFTETFVAGDAKTALRYSIIEIALPETRDLVLEVIQQGLEMLFKGNSRRRGSTPPQAGPTGYVNYGRFGHQMSNRYSSGPQRAMSRQARSRHNFDEIVLDERSEAEEVIDRLFDLVSRYESASVADLYELVGLGSSHIDHKWGWSDLTGAGVSRVRGGYLLDLPEPEPLD
jgi:hypothetical protein